MMEDDMKKPSPLEGGRPGGGGAASNRASRPTPTLPFVAPATQPLKGKGIIHVPA